MKIETVKELLIGYTSETYLTPRGIMQILLEILSEDEILKFADKYINKTIEARQNVIKEEK